MFWLKPCHFQKTKSGLKPARSDVYLLNHPVKNSLNFCHPSKGGELKGRLQFTRFPLTNRRILSAKRDRSVDEAPSGFHSGNTPVWISVL